MEPSIIFVVKAIWDIFSIFQKYLFYYLLLFAQKLATFTVKSFLAFPAGSRGKWVIFPAFPREIETAGI